MEQEPRRSAVKNQQYIQGHHRPAAAPPRAARAAAGPRGRRWIRSLEQDWRSACVAVGDSSVERGASASPSTSPSAVRREARPGSFARPRCADARGRQLSGVAADGPRPGREPGGREERIRRFRGRYREFYMSRMFCSTCSMLRNTMLLKPTRDVREGKAWAGMAKPKAPLQSPAQHQRWHRQGQRLRASSAAMAETKDIALRTAAL